MGLDLKTSIELGVMLTLASALLFLLFLSTERFSAFNLVKSQLARFKNKTELEIELEKNMTMIYTISSNAVYIGLLGTVLGVMVTLGEVGKSDQSHLIAALSLPLISTAASLVVAIIGTFLFNVLNARISEVQKLWDIEHGHAAESIKRKILRTDDEDAGVIDELAH